jgi:transcriptional regulator with XRE-family HTH domain
VTLYGDGESCTLPQMAEGGFAGRLRYWRRQRRLSQGDLARLSGIDRGAIGAIEVNPNYQPRKDVLMRLAHGLHIEPWLLLDEELRPSLKDIDWLSALETDTRLSEDARYSIANLLRELLGNPRDRNKDDTP